jgi:hypothetical protein
MRVWSIQHPSFLEGLNGVYGDFYVDREHAWDEFVDAYAWMEKKLEEKVAKPHIDNITPIWLWVQYDSEKKRKPDLRRSLNGIRGQQYVLLELEVPENLILISDHHLWHYVLNNWYIPLSSRDRGKFEKSYSTIAPRSEEGQAITEKSWDRIFDMDFKNPYVTQPKKDKRLQGVVWYLKREWLVSQKLFTAR